jgi:hypothetical protein
MENLLPQGVDVSGTNLHHMICLTLATEGSITTRVEHMSETFIPTVGTLALIPAGARCASKGTGAMRSFTMMIPKETLAFAMVERGKAGACLIERLSGEDWTLLELGHQLARRVSEGFVDDPIAWYELTDMVVHRLIDAHLSEPVAPSRGRLSPETLARVIDCIHANLERYLRRIGVRSARCSRKQCRYNAAQSRPLSIRVDINGNKRFVNIDYRGGLRLPHLERIDSPSHQERHLQRLNGVHRDARSKRTRS